MKEVKGYEDFIKLIKNVSKEVLSKKEEDYIQKQTAAALSIFDGLYRSRITLAGFNEVINKLDCIVALTAYRLFKGLEDTIIISTSTITLQNVLKEKYIDAVSKALIKYNVIDKPLKTAVCKGKSHYICDVKLNTYLSSIIRSNSENELIEILQNLCNVSASYIDLDNYSLTPYIKKCICVNKCSKVCGLYSKCRYCKLINKYRNGEYDFIIVNHNYLLTDLLKDNSKLPQYNIVVLDDIYNLYGAAWHTYKTEVSLMQIIKWIDGVKKSKVFRLEGICDEVSRCFEKLFNRLKEGGFEDDRMYIYYIGKLIELLSEMRNLNDDFFVI